MSIWHPPFKRDASNHYTINMIFPELVCMCVNLNSLRMFGVTNAMNAKQWMSNGLKTSKSIEMNVCITMRFSVEIQSKKIIILLGSTDSEYYFRSEAVIWILSIRNSSLVKTLLHSLHQLLRKLGKYLQPNFSVHWKVVRCKTPSIQLTVAHSKNDAIILKRGLEYLVRWPLRRPPILHNSIDIF